MILKFLSLTSSTFPTTQSRNGFSAIPEVLVNGVSTVWQPAQQWAFGAFTRLPKRTAQDHIRSPVRTRYFHKAGFA